MFSSSLLPARRRSLAAGLGLLLLAGGTSAYVASAGRRHPRRGHRLGRGRPVGVVDRRAVRGAERDRHRPGPAGLLGPGLLRRLHAPGGRAGRLRAPRHQLKIRVAWPTTAADFDVYLLDAQGNAVATAASSSDPEVILAAPRGRRLHRARGALRSRSAAPTRRPPRLVDQAGQPGARHGHAARASATTGRRAPCPTTTTPASRRSATASRPAPRSSRPTSRPTGSPSRTGGPPGRDASANAATRLPPGQHRRASTRSCSPTAGPAARFESQLTGVDSLTCLHRRRRHDLVAQHGRRHPQRVDHQSHRRWPLRRGRPRRPADQRLPARRLLLQPGHRGRLLRGLARRRHHLRRRRPDVRPHRVRRPARPRQGRPGRHGVPAQQGLRQATRPSPSPGQRPDLDGPHRSRRARPATPTRRSGSAPTTRSTSATSAPTADPAVATSTDHGRTWKHGQQVGTEFGIKNAVFPTVVAGSDDRAAFAYLGTPTGGQLPGRRDVPHGRLAPLRHHDVRRRPHLGDQRRHAEATRSSAARSAPAAPPAATTATCSTSST